jgi:hypothetical protein
VKIRRIKKRDGREVPFDKQKIAEAVGKAQAAVGEQDPLFAGEVSDVVELALRRRYAGADEAVPGIEEIQDLVELALIELGHASVAKAYILYRDRRARIRNVLSVHGADSGSARAPRVQVSGALESWSKGRIVAALMNEAELPRPTAEAVAANVEARVFDSGLKRISTALIRELVDNELVDMGLSQALKRTRALSVPRHDLVRWLAEDGAQLETALTGRILERHALEDLLSEECSDALYAGEFWIEDLGAFHRPLARSIPLDLFAQSGARAEGLFGELAQIGAELSRVRDTLVLDDAVPELASLPRNLLGPLLRSLEALAVAQERRIELCLAPLSGSARAGAQLARIVAELARLDAGGSNAALQAGIAIRDLTALAEEDAEAVQAIARALESGRILPTWQAGEARSAGAGLLRAPRERGVLTLASSVALNLPRAARRAGAWREDAFFEEVARMLERALDALVELERGASRSREVRSVLRGRVQQTIAPVGLTESLRILGDGELRGEQHARVLAFLAEAITRLGEPRGLALTLSPLHAERAAARFCALDRLQFPTRQPLLFAEGLSEASEPALYSCGFEVGRQAASLGVPQLALVMNALESGQILPGRGWTLAQLSQADELRARMRGSAHPLSVLPGASAHAGAAGAPAQPELYEPSVPVSRTLDT